MYDTSVQLDSDDDIFALVNDPETINQYQEAMAREEKTEDDIELIARIDNTTARMRLIIPDLNMILANTTIGIRPDDIFYFQIWENDEDYERVR